MHLTDIYESFNYIKENGKNLALNTVNQLKMFTIEFKKNAEKMNFDMDNQNAEIKALSLDQLKKRTKKIIGDAYDKLKNNEDQILEFWNMNTNLKESLNTLQTKMNDRRFSYGIKKIARSYFNKGNTQVNNSLKNLAHMIGIVTILILLAVYLKVGQSKNQIL